MPAGTTGIVAVAIAVTLLVIGGAKPEAPLIANTLPSRGPEAFLIIRFFREARSPHASFNTVTEGTYPETEPAGGPIGRWRGALGINGPDWISEVTSEIEGEPPLEASAAEIGGQYFERLGSEEEWAAFDPRMAIGSVSPFARISTVSEIEHLGTETTTDGVKTHHLLVTKWIGGTHGDMRLAGIDTVIDRDNRLDIWVNDDGVPLRSVWSATVAFREAGVRYTAEMEFSTTYSDWDDLEPIELPGPPSSADAGMIATEPSRRPRI